MNQPSRKFGFPLLMLAGFAIGAVVAVAAALVLASANGQFKYAPTLQMVFALGGIGTYAGHVLGAYRNKDAGFQPFGPLTPGVLMVGGLIVVVGGALVLGLLILIKGTPP